MRHESDRQGDRPRSGVGAMGPGRGGVPRGRENSHDLDCVLLVEARLVVIQHPVYVVGGLATLAFMERQLVEAQAVVGRGSSIVKDIVHGPGVTRGDAPTSRRIRCYAFSS